MPPTPWLFAIVLCLIVLAALAILLAAAWARARLLARRVAELVQGEADLKAEVAHARGSASEDRDARTRAETRLAEAEKREAARITERDQARLEQDRAHAAREQAERDTALANQAREAMEQRIRDWENVRAESLKAAQAAAFSTLGEMSGKLIADHKRESEETKKQQTEQVRATTEGLLNQFQSLSGTVAALAGQVSESQNRLDLVHRALASPGGAGHFAEIGLENTLKSFGLQAGRDFAMQYSVTDGAEGRTLRPDAVVFLPQRALLVIDAKASKFLLDHAAAADAAAETEALAQLARTMRQHLKDLSARDYNAAIHRAMNNSGDGALGRVFNVMYLPNEGALEKLGLADPSFAQEAAKAGIIPCGPAGLGFLLSFSRQEIDLARQAENQKSIIAQAQTLLESISIALGHIEKLGRGLRSASESFAGLTKSINGRLLPRARALVDLGIRPSAAKTLPGALATYQLVEVQIAETIEAEVTTPAALSRLAGPPDGDP